MFKLAVIGTVAVAASAMKHPVNEDIVKEIKAKATTWHPHEVHDNPLSKLSAGEVYGLLGANLQAPVGYSAPKVVSVPASFDSRDQWGSCVHEIRNQAQCGSCWAFGATEALSDRFCIASGGATNVVLSPENMVECDTSDMGCQGGWLNNAWEYLQDEGTTSYSCQPYQSGSGQGPACHNYCDDGEGFRKYQCAQGSIVEATSPAEIQSEIYQNGPMETAFTVYQDFFQYHGGIYQHTSGGMAGGHAIKVLGWGQENGINYWLCANSWGTSWGEGGFFRIAWGQCGIDSAAYACTPQL
jgi:cathepsin B